MRIKICKLLLATIGRLFPLRRHWGGRVGNWFRCLMAKGIVRKIGKNCIVERGAEIIEQCVFGDGTGIGPKCVIGSA